MAIYVNEFANTKNGCNVIMYILQIITIYNAIKDGWTVKKIGLKTFELTKIIDSSDVCLETFIDKITT